MNLIFKALIFILTLPAVSKAQVSVQANLSGSAKVASSGVMKHRQSLDCYLTGKGDKYKDFGSQQVAFEKVERAIQQNGQVSWGQSIQSPFRAEVRKTVMSLKTTSEGEKVKVALSLWDSFAGNLGQVKKEKCRHLNGQVAVSDATISGQVKVKYQVPQNIWAIRVSREDAQGAFGVGSLKPIKNVFNEGHDEGVSSSVILWVQPGQIVEQILDVPAVVGGNELGAISLSFEAIGGGRNQESLETFLGQLLDNKVGLGNQYLEKALGIVSLGDKLDSLTKKYSFSELKTISDNLFVNANRVYRDDALGFSKKVASAMAAYQIAQIIMSEANSFCKEADVLLPFTGETQKVNGLRAVSFWLSRSMNFVKTYSYTPVESLLLELKSLQDSGLMPKDIAQDQVLKAKIQKSFQLVLNSMSFDQNPFNRAYVDFSRLNETFENSSILGTKEADLLSVIRAADNEAVQFARDFGSLTAGLKPTNADPLDYTRLISQVQSLKVSQKRVLERMQDSIRIFSVSNSNDQDQLTRHVLDLLNHQINVFKNNINMPYFDAIREAYYKANIEKHDKANMACFDVE